MTRLDAEADDYRSAVWTVGTAEGSEPSRFTWGQGKDSAPRWSPDGTKLAFLSDRDGGRPQLYVIDARGGEAHKLTSLAQGATNPLWSPNGSRILVVARVSAGDDPNAPRPKNPPARVITTMKYRANGEGFIYDRRRHLFVVDAASGDTRQLTDGDWDDIQPAWSPDGMRVAFVSARHEDREFDRALDLWVIDADGGEPKRLTPGGGNVALPAWSPDGRAIAYLGFEDAEDDPLNSRLWLVPAEGGTPRCVTPGYDRQLEAFDTATPLWSSDGAVILCAVMDRGRVGLVQINLDSGAVQPCISGDRSVDSYSAAKSGAIAFTASDPVTPAELYFVEGGRERRLIDLNADWRAQVELPAPEHFLVRSDGGEVDAWLLRPAGFQADRRYPALVSVHGGPFAQYGWTFFDEFQISAGAGYAVIFCNPRGSAGREDAFARAIIGAPAEPDTADVLASLDTALERYDFIDPDRLGVLGGSYGGYLTSWIVGHTDRFAAACSERALNNRYSKEGTSDIWSGYTYLRVRQWQDPELYRRFSPLSYVCDMHTPLLIVHSEEDIRCPIEQGEQLFVALRQLRREVRFVRFPGENHELSRNGKPSHRIQRFDHILEWFNGHLHPEGSAS
jgi:dipeptidyl aminopeptidase/acylaminoacyl peptidase